MELTSHETTAKHVPHATGHVLAKHEEHATAHAGRTEHAAHPREPRERPKGKRVCIICRRERNGTPVEDDFYITTVRELKQRLGWATGNVLVVCAEDVEKARARRKRFERYLMWYGIMAIVVLGIITLSAQSAAGFLWGLLVGAFVLAFSMFTYFPRMKEKGKG